MAEVRGIFVTATPTYLIEKTHGMCCDDYDADFGPSLSNVLGNKVFLSLRLSIREVRKCRSESQVLLALQLEGGLAGSRRRFTRYARPRVKHKRVCPHSSRGGACYQLCAPKETKFLNEANVSETFIPNERTRGSGWHIALVKS